MKLQECYKELGGNYELAMKLLRSEKLLQRFVQKFLNDQSFNLLLDSMASGNGKEAFRAAHTMKGVCQNLAFTRLYESSAELAELLRPEDTSVAGAKELVEKVKEDYAATVGAIKKLD